MGAKKINFNNLKSQINFEKEIKQLQLLNKSLLSDINETAKNLENDVKTKMDEVKALMSELQNRSNVLEENLDSMVLSQSEVLERLHNMEQNMQGFSDRIAAQEKLQVADEQEFIAFYKTLLNREPETGAFKEGIYKKDLFKDIVFSEEFARFGTKRTGVTNNSLNFVEAIPSFAQSGEDNIMRFIFAALKINLEDVTYLDLGANQPRVLSNTFFAYENCKNGVLVEANPNLCEILKRERPNDVVINKCIMSKGSEPLDFYILNDIGLSSMDKDEIDNAISLNPALKVDSIVRVEAITVNEILEEYFQGKDLTILNIDIEGNEVEIINSIDFKKFRPLIIICEMIPYSPNILVSPKNQEIIDIMKSHNYVEYAFNGINSIFVDELVDGVIK